MQYFQALMVTDKWDTKTLEVMIKVCEIYIAYICSLKHIQSAQHFIAVLTPESLHDFNNGDRFHKEVKKTNDFVQTVWRKSNTDIERPTLVLIERTNFKLFGIDY